MVSCYVINIKKLATAGVTGNGVNATHRQVPAGRVHGSVYLLPKPLLRG
jgi:hypothetical protein